MDSTVWIVLVLGLLLGVRHAFDPDHLVAVSTIVSERLGHANISITLDVYSHVLPGLQEAAALRFEDGLTGGKTTNHERQSEKVRDQYVTKS